MSIRLAHSRNVPAQVCRLFAMLALAGILSVSLPISTAHAGNKANNSKDSAKNQTGKTATINASAQKTATSTLDQAGLKAIEEASRKLDPETRNSMNRLSEALRQQDKAIYNELRDDEELSVTDIGMLWEAAVERSGTIRYAIEKLSRKDATGKPVDNDNFSKRVVQNLVHLGGVAGTMWTGTPAGLIGSNMVQNILSGNPQDSALSQVTDADMVLLAKEVEALQSELITLYYNYRHAKERLTLAREASSTIAKYYDHTSRMENTTSEALQPLIQSIYDNSKQDEQSAQHAYNSTKSALTLVVGPDAVAVLDQESKTGSTGSIPGS